jgi:hypothetical protein
VNKDVTRRLAVKLLHLCGIIGLTLLLGLLSGCSLLLDDSAKQAQELEELSDTRWLIAAQGEEEPQICQEDLSRTEARQEAKEALKEEEEVQQLKESLEALGKRLLTWRAQGCVAQAEDEGDETTSQGLWALSSEEEVSLVEIPAGRDAALYLAEQEGWQEGTFWITLRGSTEEGEELWVHGELVPAEELGVLAQSEDELPLGWVSFVVPDEAGRLELAAQLFELVAEEAGLEGVSASSSEGEPLLPEVVEVEGVELAWDKMEVLILNDDGEEAEALIVVPALEDVSGERLWQGFGGFSRFDIGRALHFRVRVKRVEVGAPSNRHTRFRLVPSLPSIGEELWRRPVIKPRPRPPVVRPKPPVRKEVPDFRRPQIKPVVPKPKMGRWGSKFKSSFKFCPYRYYGKLSVFRKALCQKYEEKWLKKRWQYRVRPKLYKGIAQTYNRIGRLLGKGKQAQPGIAFFPDPKMSVLTAGFSNMNPAMANSLRKLALKKDYLHAKGVEGQGVAVLCVNVAGVTIGPPWSPIQITLLGFALCLEDVINAINFFRDLLSKKAEEEGKSVGDLYDDLVKVLSTTVRECVLDPNCDIYDYFEWTSEGPPTVNLARHPGILALYKSIFEFLLKEAGLTELEAPFAFVWFIGEFARRVSDPNEIRWFLEEFGPLPVVTLGLLKWLENEDKLDPRQIHHTLTRFPYEDPLSFFRDLRVLSEYAQAQGNPRLREDLRNLALLFMLYGIGKEKEDLENFYRVQATVQLAQQARSKGWKVFRLWVDLGSETLRWRGRIIDLIIAGEYRFKEERDPTPLAAFILIEPFLEGSNYFRLLDRINATLSYAEDFFSREYPSAQVLVIVLYGANSTSLARLCENLIHHRIAFNESARIIVVLNGRVVCQDNIDPEDAQRLCQEMGICSGSPSEEHAEEPESPPPSEGEGKLPSFTLVGGEIPLCGKAARNQVCIQ